MGVAKEVTFKCETCGNQFSYLKNMHRGGRHRIYCDNCVTSHKDGTPGRRRWTMAFSVEDWAQLEEIQEKLGVGVSEALRTSIRVYSAILKK